MSGAPVTIYDFAVEGMGGEAVPLARFRGRVLLVVNTASFCAYTPQYAELVDLHTRLGPLGFSVLAFPCGQFGGQEPGDGQEIAAFCRIAYDVNFPLFGKIDVNGPKADPLYGFLKSRKPGILGTRSVKWNFTKFLVDRSGEVVARYAPRRRPAGLETSIRRLL